MMCGNLNYMKTCTICSQNKNFIHFAKRKKSRDGLAYECKECHSKRAIVYKINNEEKVKASKDKYVENNKEKVRESKDKYIKNNKEKSDQNKRKWEKNNPGKMNAKTAKRRAAKLQATPKLTKAQHKEIQAFYIEAVRLTNTTGISHEVDHIIPLQGKTVSGLHVPWNLQILTASENASKG